MTAEPVTPAEDALCSIERAVGIFGDKWSFLILRESLLEGRTRFAEFVQALGVSPSILTHRLDVLVASGVLERREYRESGARSRRSYHPTPAGTQLKVVLGALQQWGDDFVPPTVGSTTARNSSASSVPVRIGFVEDPDVLVPVEQVAFDHLPSHPLHPSQTQGGHTP
ncbi:winged helix-turn-helix transcriptional regulator [Kineococcus sp. GCM10028916]|uniref:winged helix-turn-helix transcriptional regulator n=1 Tax=Kineococcus sp. GCM10028916 TaxID=3273394 RepID=UPI003631C3F0